MAVFDHFKHTPTFKLLEIAENPANYDPLAVHAVMEELERRGVSSHELNLLVQPPSFVEKKTIPSDNLIWNYVQKVWINNRNMDKATNRYVYLISICSLIFYLFILIFDFKKIVVFFWMFFSPDVLNIKLLYDCACLILLPIGLLAFFQGKRIGWLTLVFTWIHYILTDTISLIYSGTKYLEVLPQVVIFYSIIIFLHLVVLVVLFTPKILRSFKLDTYHVFSVITIAVLLFFAIENLQN